MRRFDRRVLHAICLAPKGVRVSDIGYLLGVEFGARPGEPRIFRAVDRLFGAGLIKVRVGELGAASIDLMWAATLEGQERNSRAVVNRLNAGVAHVWAVLSWAGDLAWRGARDALADMALGLSGDGGATCGRCGARNHAFLPFCTSCGAGMAGTVSPTYPAAEAASPLPWGIVGGSARALCPCGYSNSIERVMCRGCGRPLAHANVVHIHSPDPVKQCCTTCSAANDMGRDRCWDCGAQLGPGAPVTLPVDRPVVVNEGAVKKNLNDGPMSARPGPPRSHDANASTRTAPASGTVPGR